MLATIVMTILVFILFMFFVIMFIYFDYIPSIVGLSSYSCICSYSAHPKDPWVGGRYCVSVVLIRCLLADTPYILGHVVDHGCDTPVESFVVHSPNIGLQVGCGYDGRQAGFAWIPDHVKNVVRYNLCTPSLFCISITFICLL